MNRKEKIKTYALILLSVILVITFSLHFQKINEEKRQYEAYLNEFYAHLDSTVYSVQYLLSNREEMDITGNLMNIEHNLETTNLLLRMGDRTVDSNITSHPRFFVGRIMPNPLNDDGRLTNEQRSELEKVQKGIEYMKEGLYSEQTGQENKDLSVKEFNEIIKEGAKIGE
ncbi:hypothetical protein [Aquibacillus sediminis]|uniref:hypothetical protein n=1 Tax=Aquibacillus sediminis TaxID=2574734 RepID=UPI0011099CA4|nr:hypothetical protein [Aquibacillus sediminis]